MAKNLCIFFGGKSTEYPISLISASNIIKIARRLSNYNIIRIGISQEGKFFEYLGSDDLIAQDKWLDNPEDLIPIAFKPMEVQGFLRCPTRQKGESVRIDIAFPVLHGADGEGGPLQGFFETLGIPYVGCRQLSAALMMDKVYANIIFEQAGLDQAVFTYFRESDYLQNNDLVLEKMVDQGISFPVFVKPAKTGSSVGISKAANKAELKDSIQEALKHDHKILIEAAVNGRELEVAVLEKPDGKIIVSEAGEIIPGNEFYDYEDKYSEHSASQLRIPADLTKSQMEKIKNLAKLAFKAGDCKGLARVDFFLTNDENKFLINEINTMPGFTPISMYSKLILAAGVSEEELLESLISSAEV